MFFSGWLLLFCVYLNATSSAASLAAQSNTGHPGDFPPSALMIFITTLIVICYYFMFVSLFSLCLMSMDAPWRQELCALFRLYPKHLEYCLAQERHPQNLSRIRERVNDGGMNRSLENSLKRLNMIVICEPLGWCYEIINDKFEVWPFHAWNKTLGSFSSANACSFILIDWTIPISMV